MMIAVTKLAKNMITIKNEVRAVRAFAKRLVPLARQIVAGLREAAGVAHVIQRLPMDIFEPACLLRVNIWNPLVSVPRATEQKVGLVGDTPGPDLDAPMWGAIREMRRLIEEDIPYDCTYHWRGPEAWKWQIPYLWPGAYLAPELVQDECTGERWLYVDPISGVEHWGGILKIWGHAPLAAFAWMRFVIPLDVIMAKQVPCIAYRRRAEQLRFICRPEQVQQTRAAIERVLFAHSIDYVLTSEPYGAVEH